MIGPSRAQARPVEARPDSLLAGYVVLVGVAEALTVHAVVMAGLLLHAAIILALVGRHVVHESSLPLPVLALPSLLRLLSFTMPIPELPIIIWYALVGVPMLVACALAMWSTGWRFQDVGLRLRFQPLEAGTVASGIPLGFAAAQVHTGPAIGPDGAGGVWLGALVLLAFVVLPEELLFRGMIQRIFVDHFGGPGIFLSAILFAGIYLPTLSPGLVVVMAVAGLIFGWSVLVSGNLGGAIAGHAALLTTAWVVPGLLGS